MNWASIWHTLTVIIGVIGVAAVITGWIIKDKVLFGFTGHELADKANIVMLIAIWTALTAIVHLAKGDKEN